MTPQILSGLFLVLTLAFIATGIVRKEVRF